MLIGSSVAALAPADPAGANGPWPPGSARA